MLAMAENPTEYRARNVMLGEEACGRRGTQAHTLVASTTRQHRSTLAWQGEWADRGLEEGHCDVGTGASRGNAVVNQLYTHKQHQMLTYKRTHTKTGTPTHQGPNTSSDKHTRTHATNAHTYAQQRRTCSEVTQLAGVMHATAAK